MQTIRAHKGKKPAENPAQPKSRRTKNMTHTQELRKPPGRRPEAFGAPAGKIPFSRRKKKAPLRGLKKLCQIRS